jgi:hypothetical protein
MRWTNMPRKIRLGVFETNSSSAHTITIAESVSGIYESLPVSDQGVIILEGGDFCDEWEKFNDAITKANYAAQFTENYEEYVPMLIDVIKEHTGADIVIVAPTGYLDHDSTEVGLDAFKSKETLKEFLFSPNSWLFLGSSRDVAPPNFYDVVNVAYTHRLEVKGCNLVNMLTKVVTGEELVMALRQVIEHSSSLDKHYIASTYCITYQPSSDPDSFAKIDQGKVILYKVKRLRDCDMTLQEPLVTKELTFRIVKV